MAISILLNYLNSLVIIQNNLIMENEKKFDVVNNAETFNTLYKYKNTSMARPTHSWSPACPP